MSPLDYAIIAGLLALAAGAILVWAWAAPIMREAVKDHMAEPHGDWIYRWPDSRWPGKGVTGDE